MAVSGRGYLTAWLFMRTGGADADWIGWGLFEGFVPPAEGLFKVASLIAAVWGVAWLRRAARCWWPCEASRNGAENRGDRFCQRVTVARRIVKPSRPAKGRPFAERKAQSQTFTNPLAELFADGPGEYAVCRGPINVGFTFAGDPMRRFIAVLAAGLFACAAPAADEAVTIKIKKSRPGDVNDTTKSEKATNKITITVGRLGPVEGGRRNLQDGLSRTK